MDARNWRLLKIFATNIGWMLLWAVGFASYVATLYLLPDPWGMVLGIMVPVGFFLKVSWDMAKYRLERQEFAEKRLADQLVNSD